ncbi:MAG: YihY/virulence factor BrkB family protein [Gammaproteobacteria bacterium]|nr:YihY/virulence factor BrkB family protein [Gammaproteobacteria bacterium]
MSLSTTSLQNLLNRAKGSINGYLWQQDSTQLSLWKRTALRSSQIFVAIVRDLLLGQLSLRAMSLVFTTVIGFFPLLALTFAVLKGLGVHNALEPTLLTLLQPLGDDANTYTADILGYVDAIQVELIGITSVGLLLYFVLDMMRKIEGSFNYIWSVRQGRSWSSRVSEYLFAVIVSPLLLFLSITITSSVNTSFFNNLLENLSYGIFIIEFIAFIAPIFLMSLAFAFAYSFLPNTRVQFGSAFIGGLVTTIIWKLMGSVFQDFFIASARESIYLAFASVVAVMFFVYVGWLVALIGSSIAYYHQFPSKTRIVRDESNLSIAQQEELGLSVASVIIDRFNSGLAPLSESELAESLSGHPIVIEDSLLALEEIGLIRRTADEPTCYLPAKSVTSCSLFDVWKALRSYNADTLKSASTANDQFKVKDFYARLDETIQQELGNMTFSDTSEPHPNPRGKIK